MPCIGWRVGECGGLAWAGRQVPTQPLDPQQDGGGEKIRWKKLVGQGKSSLTQQKPRPCAEAKENRRFIPYGSRQCPATSREAVLQYV